MENSFKSLVLTYRTAPVEVREMVALDKDGVYALLKFAREYTSATDVLVVSTCNRTEVYYRADQNFKREILNGIRLIKGLNESIEQYFTEVSGSDAVKHLFEVSIGLDAQVIGDLQISGQIKHAYQWSADQEMAGPFLHRLMHTIFFANKRVVQETSFRDGAASISYAAKELAEELTLSIKDPKVMVLGVGEIGKDVCLNLVDSRFQHVTIVNRTFDKAVELSKTTGFKVAHIENLTNEIVSADVIISSVAGQTPIINASCIDGTSIFSHKFFIDLSIPRSVDPDLESNPGIVLYNMDDITERTSEAVLKRKAAVPVVKSIIAETIAEFQDWSKEMIISPVIQQLKNALEQLRREEVARYLKHASKDEADRIEGFSKSLVQKIMKLPVLQLKAACRRGDPENLIEVLQELFDLEKAKKNS